MSLMSRNSPILSSLSARRKHHIHPEKIKAEENGTNEKRERPFGELKFDTSTQPAANPAYKSIFSL